MTRRAALAVAVGTVIKVVFPPQPIGPGKAIGAEQMGVRPAVVMALPDSVGPVRRPLLLVVPCTSDKGYEWVRANPILYPILGAGAAGLPLDTVVMLDQVRAIDPERVIAILGRLNAAEWQPLKDGLRAALNL